MKTTEEFKIEATKIHGNYYDYSKSIFKSSNIKILITCPKHGDFLQIPKNHLRNHGCMKCYRESLKLSTDEFIKRAIKIHGNKYDYTPSVYTLYNENLIINCKIHGSFNQLPRTHLDGHGCPRCNFDKKILSKEQFYNKCLEVHGNKYNYEKTIYLNMRTEITITCKVHGDFTQLPFNHVRGSGCRGCGRNIAAEFLQHSFKINSSNTHGVVYLILIYNESEKFCKIGVTTNLKLRLKPIKTHYNVKVILTEYKDKETLCIIEKNCHDYFRNYKYIPKIKFLGYTECFTTDVIKWFDS